MEYVDILSRIKKLRQEKNISQEEIAIKLQIDRTTYNHYENNYQTFPLNHLNTLCNLLEVSLDYIFNLSNIIRPINYKDDIDIKISSQRLKEFRKDNKLTQDKLAKKLNTTQPVIANYERGRTIISTLFLYAICKEYGVSADYLLGKKD